MYLSTDHYNLSWPAIHEPTLSIRYFFMVFDKVYDEKQLKEEVYFGSQFKGWVHNS